MPATTPSSLTIHAARRLIEDGQLDPRELLEDLLARIERLNPTLRAYIAIDPARVREQLDARLRSGGQGRLFGIPITIKDNLCVEGEETTCASRILKGFHPPYHATAVERLLQAGAIVVPRANMDEFAFGSSTESSAAGSTANPWDTDCVPGGSSGGSASAVAADLAMGALGSDTGGSIRQPAGFCGVVGLKPTYGRVSRYGLIAFASSLDQIGPITKDVTDCALLLSILAGHDPRDSTSASVEVPDYVAQLSQPVKGLRFGVPKEYVVTEGIDPAVTKAMEQAIQTLEGLGMKRVSIGLPHTSYAVATYYVAATAEASSNLARYDGVQYGLRANGSSSVDAAAGSGEQHRLVEMYTRTRLAGFGQEAKRRVLLGTYVLSHGYYDAYYLKALKVRTLIKQDFDQAFTQCDVVLAPTSPSEPFRLGEKVNNPLQMYLSDIFTIPASLAGIPAVSVPCGFSEASRPLGMQVMAAPFQEARLLQVAHAYEQATEWHFRKPAASVQKGGKPRDS